MNCIARKSLPGLLVLATALAGCQPNPPKTQDDAVNTEAVVQSDSAKM